MIARCTRPYSGSWDRYGGRGIKIEWNSFDSFIIDMKPSYELMIQEIKENSENLANISIVLLL